MGTPSDIPFYVILVYEATGKICSTHNDTHRGAGAITKPTNKHLPDNLFQQVEIRENQLFLSSKHLLRSYLQHPIQCPQAYNSQKISGEKFLNRKFLHVSIHIFLSKGNKKIPLIFLEIRLRKVTYGGIHTLKSQFVT